MFDAATRAPRDLHTDSERKPRLLDRTFGRHLLQDRIAVLEREGAALRDRLHEHSQAVLAREASLADCESVVRARDLTICGYQDTIRRYEGVIGGLEAAVRDADRGRAQAVATLEASRTALFPAGSALPRTGPNHRPMSAADADRWINAWKDVAAKHSDAVLAAGQTLIEPYILERVIHDQLARLIIATVEGKGWYDNSNDIELPHLLRLGMIRRGDTVFDCGANQGVNSLFYARSVGEAGRVYAFDPFGLNIDIGTFNARMNDVANINFIRAGLSDRAGSVVVSLADQSVGLINDSAADAVAISLVPLDAFAALRPSFVKIDIEGAEVNALEGAHEVLALNPAIYIEIHPNYLPHFGRSAMDVFKHISLDRYTCYIDHPGVPAFSAYRAEFEMTEGCALYCVPKARPALTRLFCSSAAPA